MFTGRPQRWSTEGRKVCASTRQPARLRTNEYSWLSRRFPDEQFWPLEPCRMDNHFNEFSARAIGDTAATVGSTRP